MSKNVIIIGGGIIGLCSAYYLQKEGHQVTVIDQSSMNGGASYVNAGYITPSHIVPLAAPGMMTKGLKWMFNSSSPFYMKPRLDKDFLKWAWYFKKSATHKKVQKAIPLIREINILSRELYQEMYDSGNLGTFQWERKGLLMLYTSEKAGEVERKVAAMAKNENLEVKELSLSALKQLEPTISNAVKGALHYECDAHTTPNQIMQKLIAYLTNKGVVINKDEKVVDIKKNGNVVNQVISNKTVYKTDEVVVASGSWSHLLAKKLGFTLPLEAGKGYRINVERPTGINLPAVLMEAKVAVTPMEGFTRFAGTMELSGINHTIRKERVQAIAKAAEQYYTNLTINTHEIEAAQCGLRPVSPDGLPYIGRPTNFNNVTFATGHAMMGWSLGPATGKLVAEIIDNKKTAMEIAAFHPNRKF